RVKHGGGLAHRPCPGRAGGRSDAGADGPRAGGFRRGDPRHDPRGPGELHRRQGRGRDAEELLDGRPHAREPFRVSAGAANKGRSELSTRVDSLASFVEGLVSGSIDVIDLTQPLSERTPMIQLPPPFANTPNWKTHE